MVSFAGVGMEDGGVGKLCEGSAAVGEESCGPCCRCRAASWSCWIRIICNSRLTCASCSFSSS